jgi:hypothetical protein
LPKFVPESEIREAQPLTAGQTRLAAMKTRRRQEDVLFVVLFRDI